MAYDQQLAERIRQLTGGRREFTEREMFGGLAFLLNENMCVGLWKGYLIARIGPAEYGAALEDPAVQEFDITGRPMNGWVMVDAEGTESPDDLRSWFARCESFVKTLPKKNPKPATKPRTHPKRTGKSPKRHEGRGGKS